MNTTGADSWLFTSESVTEGHPDKVADQISDAVLDALLARDPQSRVACETFVTTGLVVVGGEITTSAYVDIAGVARSVLEEIGYIGAASGFDAETCGVMVAIDEQSPDIASGVATSHEVRTGDSSDAYDEIGAGDQGMMFGYACDETDELMPLPITLAHHLTRRLAQVRRDGTIPYLLPDGKAQVSVRYDDGKPTGVMTVVVSTHHMPSWNGAPVEVANMLRPAVLEHVVAPVLGDLYDPEATRVLVNPAGEWTIGGPRADAGLTGRKIIVDTYGGMSRHGGGAFSGKDPSKVDRSAAYAARWVAKNVVAAGLASRCELQVAYAIGAARPVSIHIETFGTETEPIDLIEQAVHEVFDLRPASIVEQLDLRQPIYRQVAAYGHFGRADLDLPWENTNRASELRATVTRLGNGSGALAAGSSAS